jgi:hypothetical protein
MFIVSVEDSKSTIHHKSEKRVHWTYAQYSVLQDEQKLHNGPTINSCKQIPPPNFTLLCPNCIWSQICWKKYLKTPMLLQGVTSGSNVGTSVLLGGTWESQNHQIFNILSMQLSLSLCLIVIENRETFKPECWRTGVLVTRALNHQFPFPFLFIETHSRPNFDGP